MTEVFMKKHFLIFLVLFVIAVSAFGYPKKRRYSSPSQPAMAALPAGTVIRARIIESLNSGTTQAGDAFHATLEDPIVVNGQTLFPSDSDLSGSVLAVHRSGRLSDPGTLTLGLTSVTNGSQTMPLTVTPFEVKGESHTASNVEKIGGGTAVGALIGGLAGGGKGAAIGAGAGAAAGTGVAAATGKHEAKIESETVLSWTTTAPAATSTATATGYSQPAPTLATPSTAPANSSAARAPAPAPDASGSFSARDRRVIRGCFEDNRDDLPPGLAKRDSLPPGLQKQMDRNGTLPPGLQKRVRPLPAACERQLPSLPNDWERVVYGGRVMLIDSASHILDSFFLDEE
jgi:hypothetical protein